MNDTPGPHIPRTKPRFSATFDPHAIAEIQRAAATGIYDIRGGGTKRKLPHFDDLLFLGASISRYPLEGYREKCATNVVLGSRFAAQWLLQTTEGIGKLRGRFSSTAGITTFRERPRAGQFTYDRRRHLLCAFHGTASRGRRAGRCLRPR